MKKTMFTLVMAITLLIGSIPAVAAAPASKSVVWSGSYEDKDWTGVNVTVIDGKTNPTKRLYPSDASNMTVIGDWIYFLTQDPDSDVVAGNIVRMKKDGSGKQELTKGNKASRIVYDGQTLYYGAYNDNYENELWTMKLDGTGAKRVLKQLKNWSYTISKGTMFFVENGALYRSKLDGTGKTVISKGDVDPYEGYKLFGDVLYFSEFSGNTSTGYLVDMTGKNKVAVPTKAAIRPVAYINSWFYYEEQTFAKDGKPATLTLMKIKRDGKTKKAVAMLGESDRFIGLLDTSFVYRDAASRMYTVTAEGKIAKPAK